MIVEGERVKSLVAGAIERVVLCSPFIKAKTFATILGVIRDTASVQIVTRWRVPEVAAGLSDLEVFDIANERPKTKLSLMHSLHAKLYLADDACLVGSANLTASALGWRADSNVEILIPAKPSDPDVALLLNTIKNAKPATFQIRDDMAKHAAEIDVPLLDESKDADQTETEAAGLPWLPRCAAPDKLHAIYNDPEATIAARGTRADAIADLRDLMPPIGLSGEEFTAHISKTLSRLPSFGRITDSVPAGMTDAQGESIVAELRPSMQKPDVQKQWKIVRDWISVFFHDQFEVAAQSYVVRLKPR